MNVVEIDSLYERYGYDLKSSLSSNDIRVYTLNKGVYYGADIVYEEKVADYESIYNQLSKSGYACRDVQIDGIESAKDRLFESFFHSDQLKERLSNKYDKFAKNQTSLLKVDYEYVPVSYMIDNQEYDSSKHIIESVLAKLKESGAQLIIIEAAAGFGKTCTSYEVIHQITLKGDKLAPIFTELSRDRRAAIFKHILNDVIINEFHSLLDENLVIHEIQSGRIPLIIDGFDELLSKEQDKGADEFEQVETMLSTIGDLLKGEAKIILTGRKTAIFAGDSFQEWMEGNSNDFSVTRYLINPPRLEDWLSEEKRKLIEEKNIPIKDVANPVLLAFVRSLSVDTFLDVVEEPEQIVNKYFSSILDREQERQELRVNEANQLIIFKNLAVSMMELNITSESKEWIKYLIEEQNRELLDEVRKSYPPSQRPTIDEMCNTLSNHALLDRKGSGDQIGFINDFIFGTFIGKGLVQLSQEEVDKVSTHMFELASTAFQFQSKSNRDVLWNKLSIIDRFSNQEKFLTEYLLNQSIESDFVESTFRDFGINHISFIKQNQFDSCVFANCSFESCSFDNHAFKNTSFVNCVFHKCEFFENDCAEASIFMISCEDYGSGFIGSIEGGYVSKEGTDSLKEKIVSKFFNKSNRPRHKKISFLVREIPSEQRAEAIKIIESLKRNDFLKSNGDNAFLTDKGIQQFNSLAIN